MQTSQPDTFNLLVLALVELQSRNSSDPWSWYQIAGIHGVPFIPWPNPKDVPAKTNPKMGYCPHQSILFGTWHRPYMLVLEQAIVGAATDIVAQYTGDDKTKYANALKLLRWPYWDWADANDQSFTPSIVKQDTLKVVAPDGAKTISNPFFNYKFKGTENSPFLSPLTGAKMTTRGTSSYTGKTDESAASISMQKGFENRRQLVYNTLMAEDGFNDFSSSVENIHNTVHGMVGGGGGGFMWFLYYSSYDPIFWLHHNNVDRMMAIWQAANPGAKLTPDDATDTYQNVALGQNDTLDTPLYPFKHPDGSWWTSNDVSSANSIWKYGYGFPELPCGSVSSSSDLDTVVTKKINDLYKTKITGRTPAKKSKRAADKTVLEWNVNVVIDQAEISGSFSVVMFLGTPPSSVDDWQTSDENVGDLTVLGNPGMAKKSKIVSATIPLTPALTKRNMANLSQNDTDAYLKKTLVWSVMSEGKVIDITTLGTLKVGVTNNQVVIPGDNTKKPMFSRPMLRTKITQKKEGGVTTPEDLKNPEKINGKRKMGGRRFQKIVTGNSTTPVAPTASSSGLPDLPAKEKENKLKRRRFFSSLP
ncbi:Tyrosinase [Dactylellina cionopaga]|nr:Tyrosinase [Dactylellina cionopaga]